MATNTYVALDKVTLGTSAASVTFSGISQSYTDLVIVSSAFYASSGGNRYASFQLGNGTVDTGTNYSWTYLDTFGGSPSVGKQASNNFGLHSFTSDIPTTTAMTTIMQIQNYSNTTTYKTMLNRFNAASPTTGVYVNLWQSTAAINIITISAVGANFASGTTFSLYGIAAEGVSPAAKATGGTIYSDASYYYHVFNASGTFTPTQSITADCLVVAGGGGGAGNAGGAGGAGGLIAHTSQSLTATGYTVTVGGGGASGGTTSNGSQGVNSQFGALTAAVGGGRGGNADASGGTGGSGGGGGGYDPGPVGGAGTSGQGNTGGTGVAYTSGGSGGGAGAAASGVTAGVGSTTYSSWGVVTGIGQNVSGTYYLAGGGAGGRTSGTANAGAYGGGGAGGSNTSAGTAGTPNTGGGGGGAWANSVAASAAGGSGVVIVRYAK